MDFDKKCGATTNGSKFAETIDIVKMTQLPHDRSAEERFIANDN